MTHRFLSVSQAEDAERPREKRSFQELKRDDYLRIIHNGADSIIGELICSKCRAILAEKAIEYGEWESEPLANIVSMHKLTCSPIKFPYSFTSPLTYIQQRDIYLETIYQQQVQESETVRARIDKRGRGTIFD